MGAIQTAPIAAVEEVIPTIHATPEPADEEAPPRGAVPLYPPTDIQDVNIHTENADVPAAQPVTVSSGPDSVSPSASLHKDDADVSADQPVARSTEKAIGVATYGACPSIGGVGVDDSAVPDYAGGEDIQTSRPSWMWLFEDSQPSAVTPSPSAPLSSQWRRPTGPRRRVSWSGLKKAISKRFRWLRRPTA